MSVYVESNIAFDFTAAKTVIEHDRTKPTVPGGVVHGNNLWSGVDFCIEDTNGEWIWREVKNWDPARIDPRRRGGTRWSFLCKMRSSEYMREIRGKFIGTTAFLAWKNLLPLVPTQFVLLFEPPNPLDAALLSSRNDRMKRLILLKSGNWAQPIGVSVRTAKEWNLRFSDYPATVL